MLPSATARLFGVGKKIYSCFPFDEAGNGRILEPWEGLESNSTYQAEVIPIEQTALYETSPLLPVCPKLFVDACVLL